MNQTNVSKLTPTKAPAKSNGSPTTDATDPQAEVAAAAPTVTTTVTTTPASDKKPVTVMLSEHLHKRVKITAELSGVSLSDLVEEQLKIVVKERLPGLLAKLDTGD
jgi:hypothetical protein